MLVDLLKQLLATQQTFSIKAAGFHWNCEGQDFLQVHEYLGEFYASLYLPLDQIAEYIRQLNQYAPASLTRYKELSLVADSIGPVTASNQIFLSLQADLEVLVLLLNQVFDLATLEREQAVANFAASELDQRKKDQWKLRSLLKNLS